MIPFDERCNNQEKIDEIKSIIIKGFKREFSDDNFTSLLMFYPQIYIQEAFRQIHFEMWNCR